MREEQRGEENVPQALVPMAKALPLGSEASLFVGGSGKVLPLGLEMEVNSVAGSAEGAAERSGVAVAASSGCLACWTKTFSDSGLLHSCNGRNHAH